MISLPKFIQFYYEVIKIQNDFEQLQQIILIEVSKSSDVFKLMANKHYFNFSVKIVSNEMHKAAFKIATYIFSTKQEIKNIQRCTSKRRLSDQLNNGVCV